LYIDLLLDLLLRKTIFVGNWKKIIEIKDLKTITYCGRPWIRSCITWDQNGMLSTMVGRG
ncbi:hypothetical protein BZG82_12830, partial [Salinivibrio sp. PR5]